MSNKIYEMETDAGKTPAEKSNGSFISVADASIAGVRILWYTTVNRSS